MHNKESIIKKILNVNVRDFFNDKIFKEKIELILFLLKYNIDKETVVRKLQPF